MNARRHLALAATGLALVLSACSGGSDETIEANATSTTTSSTTIASSSTTVPSSTSVVDTTTTTTVVETTTTTSETTTTDAENEYVLALAPDGLIVVEQASGSTNMLPFGSAQSIVVNAVTDLLGPPTSQEVGSAECGNGQDFVAIWDDEIMLEFAESSFLAWSLRPGSTLTDLAGVGLGTIVSSLRDSWAINIDETTLGTEFTTSADGSGYGGLLSANTDNGFVDGLWAGSICTFR